MPSIAPVNIEGYEVLRKLSEGASAEVYLARSADRRDAVISEVMRPELMEDAAVVARFRAEAVHRRALAHPHLAKRTGAGTTADGRPWLVTEPVGESLAARLSTHGTMPVEALVPLVCQVCDALEFLHGRGLVHANVKPASVYVVDGQVKLVDFGLAFFRPGRTLPRPRGVILVESEYLAPERVRGQRATPASDLYGVGVLLYEMLTGFPPFTGTDSSVVRRRQVEERAAPLPESFAAIAPIIDRCLAKEPSARFPSASALKAALRDLGDGDAIDIELTGSAGALAPPAGEAIGSWELQQPLGEGAMGRVFAARHKTLDRRVAVKLLKPELAQSRAEVDRFVLEAQAVNKIRHPHIVEIYDCVNETLPGGERRVYFVMELLQGQTLGELLRQGPLPIARAVRLLRQVASALDAGHRLGVMHRDVKPDNIFVTTRDGADFAKVLDFGVAKLRNQHRDGPEGTVAVGTPSYMAPEVVRGASAANHRADVYGLGVVLYRLLSGQLPFSGRTFEQLGRAILSDPPPPLPAATQRGEPIPGGLRQLVEACLEKDPERRPQTMAEVGSILDGFAAEDPVMEPAPHQHRKSFTHALAFGAGAGVVLLAAGIFLLRGADPELTPPPRPVAPVEAKPVPTPAPPPKPPPAQAEARRLAIDTIPTGAQVVRLSDKKVLGTTPIVTEAPADDEVELELTLDGYKPGRLRLNPGSPGTIPVPLEALPAPTPEPPAVAPKKPAPRPVVASPPRPRPPKPAAAPRPAAPPKKPPKKEVNPDGVLDPFG